MKSQFTPSLMINSMLAMVNSMHIHMGYISHAKKNMEIPMEIPILSLGRDREAALWAEEQGIDEEEDEEALGHPLKMEV